MAIPKLGKKRGVWIIKALKKISLGEMCSEPFSDIGSISEIYLMDQSEHKVVDGAKTSPMLPMVI